MYFDPEKNKYFSIGREEDSIPVNKSTVQAAEWRMRRERLHDQGSTSVAPRRRLALKDQLVGALGMREQGHRLEPSHLTQLLLRSSRMRRVLRQGDNCSPASSIQRFVGNVMDEAEDSAERTSCWMDHGNLDRNGGGLMSVQVDDSQTYLAWGGLARYDTEVATRHCFHLMKMKTATRWSDLASVYSKHDCTHATSALNSRPDMGGVLVLAATCYERFPSGPSATGHDVPAMQWEDGPTEGGWPYLIFMWHKPGRHAEDYRLRVPRGTSTGSGWQTRATSCALSLDANWVSLGALDGHIWHADTRSLRWLGGTRFLPTSGQYMQPSRSSPCLAQVPLVQASCPAHPHLIYNGTNFGRVIALDLREPPANPPALDAYGRVGHDRIRLGISSVCVLSTGDRCVVSNLDGDIDLLDMRSSYRSTSIVQSYPGHFNARGTSTQVQINEEANIVYATAPDNITRLWSLSKGTLLNEIGVDLRETELDLSRYPTVHPLYLPKGTEGRGPPPCLVLLSFNTMWMVDLGEALL